MFPLLKLSSDGKEHSSKECVESLSQVFKLTEKKKKKNMLQKTFQYSMTECIGPSYLKNAGLIKHKKRIFQNNTKRRKSNL